VLCDIAMPEVDGYEMVRRLRALPATAGGRVPAAALSAYARVEDRRRALLAGFNIHVAKPVDPEELIAVVASLAGKV
jgi:CheY-like chemotaxis protein